MRAQGGEEWWKLHEAAMLALGSAQEIIESQIKAGNVQFDIGGFMTDVVLQDLNSPGQFTQYMCTVIKPVLF